MNSYCPECQTTFDRGVGICPRDDTELVPTDQRDDPLEGAVLDERYRLETLLGAGGMGVVYRATQLAVDRDVAVKILRHELGDDSLAHERFSREAKHISSLRHPNIVQLIDFGRDVDLDAWFLVMEHVEGHSLADLLSDGRLAWELALEIVYQVCGALLASHEREMIHRDLKPENLHLMPVADGTLQVKVLDFGIARCLEHTTQLTESGMVCGTPAYLAPEQARDGEIGAETDLYSLGICLYEMLTGHLPFEASTPLQLMFKHVHESPAPIRESVPAEAPVDGLQSLLDTMLAKDRADRPESARGIRDRIEEIRRANDRPLRGLSGQDDWRERLGEMVHPRAEDDGEDRRLADRRSVDPLAMTAGTLQTIHPTFKKFEHVSTHEWTGRREAPTDPRQPFAMMETIEAPAETADVPERPEVAESERQEVTEAADDRPSLTMAVAGLSLVAVVLGGVAFAVSGDGGSRPSPEDDEPTARQPEGDPSVVASGDDGPETTEGRPDAGRAGVDRGARGDLRADTGSAGAAVGQTGGSEAPADDSREAPPDTKRPASSSGGGEQPPPIESPPSGETRAAAGPERATDEGDAAAEPATPEASAETASEPTEDSEKSVEEMLDQLEHDRE